MGSRYDNNRTHTDRDMGGRRDQALEDCTWTTVLPTSATAGTDHSSSQHSWHCMEGPFNHTLCRGGLDTLSGLITVWGCL